MPLVRSHTKTRDKGKSVEQAIRAAIRKVADGYVTIGVHEDAGRYEGAHAPEVVQVALWQEFGTENMRARPFLRPAIDNNLPLIESWQVEGLGNVAFKGWSAYRALNMLGARIRELVKSQILHADYSLDDYSPTYLAFKRRYGFKGTNPLILTQLMLDSIQYRVFIDGREASADSGSHKGQAGAEGHAEG